MSANHEPFNSFFRDISRRRQHNEFSPLNVNVAKVDQEIPNNLL